MIDRINKLIADKKISVSELTGEYINRIKADDGVINSFISHNFDKALSLARLIDTRLAKGGTKSVLGGIPMSVKDNISVHGLKMSCGSRMLDNYYPPYTASSVSALLDNEAILLGKNNMDEFAMGSTGETSYYGAVTNPLDSARVAGGSSSGCAAAVASDMAVYSIGSDTGGSVRLPASYCGCVGFKPGYGAVSRYGLTAYASSLDQIGIISRSVSDIRKVFRVVAFPDKYDMTSVPVNNYKAFDNQKNDLTALKIGIDCSYIDIADDDIKMSFYSSIDVLKSLGADVREIKLPASDDILASYYIIACAELASNLSRYDGTRYGYRSDNYSSFDEMAVLSRSEGFGDEVKKRIILGNLILSRGYKDRYYANAMNCRASLIEEMLKIFSEHDIVAIPTSPTKVPLIASVKSGIDNMYRMDIYTVLANLCQIPAISIPCGSDNEGMPVGIQLHSARGSDYYLLSVADIIERNISAGGGIYE